MWCLLVAYGLVLGCERTPSNSMSEPDGSSKNATDVSDKKLSGKLVLTGSSTVAPLAAEIGMRFEARHPDVRVDVQSGGSSRGIADALSGLADIGMSSRALKAEETDKGLLSHRVALDGICLIVHRENEVSPLSDEQVVAVYTGKFRRWNELGGGDTEIVVVNKAEGRATLEAFLAYFRLKNSDIQADVIGAENQQVIQTVAGNRAAIGYVSIGEAEAEAKAGTAIRLLPVNGIAPSIESVACETFPITRPLILVTKGTRGELAEAFIKFAQSRDVHELVQRQGFVPSQP